MLGSPERSVDQTPGGAGILPAETMHTREHDVGQEKEAFHLGTTDHDHLGKLLTYAAGTNAGVAIWVATDFHDEHRQALQWLNSITPQEQPFFGVQVEVLRIGDSAPAPSFDVLVQPSEWVKDQRSGKSSSTSPKQEAYARFFSKLLQKVKKSLPNFTLTTKGLPQNWSNLPSGRSEFVYGVNFSAGARFRVEFYIDTGDRDLNKRAFDFMLARKEAIEHGVGEPLSWERLEE